MAHWFSSLSRFWQIIWCVLGLHVLFILLLTLQYFIVPKAAPRKKVMVTTTYLTPSIPSPVVTVSKAATASTTTTSSKPKNSVVSVAKTPMKTEKPSKSNEKSKNAVSSSNTNQTAALFKDIENSFQTLTQAPIEKKSKQTITIPKLQLETNTPAIFGENVENSSTELVILFLQQSLQLPEFGKVKALLSINPMGKLEHFEILESKSLKNANFLKNQLPQLQFPCLNEAVSLTVVFSNDV